MNCAAIPEDLIDSELFGIAIVVSELRPTRKASFRRPIAELCFWMKLAT